MRLRAKCAVLLAGLVLSYGIVARADEPQKAPVDVPSLPSGLELLPDSAGLVIRVASPDRLLGNLSDMLNAISPVAAVALPGAESGLRNTLYVEKLDSLQRTAPAYLAVFPLPEEQQPFVVLAIATNEDQLRRDVLRAPAEEQLQAQKRPDGFEKIDRNGMSWYFGHCGPFTAFTPSEAVVQRLAGVQTGQGTFSATLDARLVEEFHAGDAAVLINAKLLTQVFQAQVQEGRKELLRGIDSLPPEAFQGTGADPNTVKGALAKTAGAVFDTILDAQMVCARVNFSGDGVAAGALTTFGQGSDADKVLSENPGDPLASLGLLPTGAPLYYASRIRASGLLAELGTLLQTAYPQQGTQPTAPEGEDKSGKGATAGGFSWPLSATTGMITWALTEAEHPEVLIEALRSAAKQAKEVKTPAFSQSTEYKEQAETFKDRPVDLSTQKFTVGGEDMQAQISRAMLQRFFGGEGLQTRIIALEGIMAAASGNEPRFLQQLVEGLESGEGVLGLDSSFSTTRDHLAADANLVVLFNLPQFVLDAIKTFREVPPFDAVLRMLPFNFGLQPASSFAGLSIGAEPQALRVRVFVPVGQPRGMLQIFGQAQ